MISRCFSHFLWDFPLFLHPQKTATTGPGLSPGFRTWPLPPRSRRLRAKKRLRAWRMRALRWNCRRVKHIVKHIVNEGETFCEYKYVWYWLIWNMNIQYIYIYINVNDNMMIKIIHIHTLYNYDYIYIISTVYLDRCSVLTSGVICHSSWSFKSSGTTHCFLVL